MKKLYATLTVLQIPLDYLMLILAGICAYFLRYVKFITALRPVVFDLPFKEFFIIILIVGIFWIAIFAWLGLYSFKRMKFAYEISKIIQGCFTSMMLVIVYMFLIREIFSSRFIILLSLILSIVFVITGRLLMRSLRYFLYKKKINTYNTVIIGNNAVTQILLKEYKEKYQHGVNVIKIIDKSPQIFDELSKITNADEIIQADYNISRNISSKIIDYCQRNHIIFKYVGGDFESKVTNTETNTIAGIPLIELKRTPLSGWGKIIKRIIDIIGSILLIIITSPIMAITALAIKIDSKGPVFADIPKRAGQYGIPFTFYKFRSMYTGAHKDQKKLKSEREGLFKIKDDPRITRVGKFIRKTSIDELPQFFNVLIGNMSLVGPRPHFPNEYDEEQIRVLDIKPGITGIAQISGRSDLCFNDEIKLDNYYIENWSLGLDLWIILKTPFIVITKMKSAV